MTPVSLVAIQNRARSLRQSLDPMPQSQMPIQGEYFHVRNSIVCPAAGAAETVVASYTVPDGFTAIINMILNLYIGAAAPVEGDVAELFYGIRINQDYYARDFGQIATTLGSLTQGPYPVPGGMILAAGSLVEYTVTVPAGSPVATGAPNRIHCQLLGWHWPEAV